MTDAAFEGPPSPYQMEVLFSKLVIDGKYERAERLATTMRDWWMAQPHGDDDYTRASNVYRWLGAASVIFDVIFGRSVRKSDRTFKRARAAFGRATRRSR